MTNTKSSKWRESFKVQSAGPGAYIVSVAVEGLELSVKLYRAGARIPSVGAHSHDGRYAAA